MNRQADAIADRARVENAKHLGMTNHSAGNVLMALYCLGF